MKNTCVILLASILMCSAVVVHSQTIYSKAFGNPNDRPIIYLHGGPGYNSAGFEVTTAEKLSKNGFYVIIYDRRGEGRSKDKNAVFTFVETYSDLDSIYDLYNVEAASLLGHSFGGVIATLYAEKYPDKIQSLILMGAPISMQETLSTIVKSSKTLYESRNDSANLNYIAMLEKMDKSSIEYSSYCFSHAMQNGFYFPSEPSEEASNIYSKFRSDTTLLRYSSAMTYDAPRGFFDNENYTTLDLNNNLMKVLENKTPVFGLYGRDDGLFSIEQASKIESQLGKENFRYLENCSHNPFIDQQLLFIASLTKWMH